MPEGRTSRLGPVLYQIYARCRRKRIRRWVMEMVCRLEGGQIHSNTLRRIMAEVHGVEVGMYSDGGSFRIYAFDRGTKIGRYCSIADTATAWGANHPMSAKSMHAFFYNPFLGAVTKDPLTRTELTIGNDVWLGHNSIILNTVRTIGDGAVVGAGSVVHQDVPPYAVVAGNPARVVRYRFSKERIEELLEERWWEHSLEEIKNNGMAEFRIPVEGLEDRQQPAQDCNTPNGVVNVVNNAARTAVGDELEQFIREVILGGQQMELDREAALIEEGVLDSLGLLQIVQFIEERFGVVVADGDVTLEQFGSISAMESYVQQLRAGE